MDVKTNDELQSNNHKDPLAHRLWIGGYALLALACLTVYFLTTFDVFNVFGDYRRWLQRGSLFAFFALVILTGTKIVELIISKRSHSKNVRYNLVRVVRLICFFMICMVVASFLFKNWYTAAVSFGLISLILGFALQTPISSLIGWVYIVMRVPFKIGDRIQISTYKGDVVEINYLDTTLWEFGGDYLTNDLPSGRLIRIPNSLVFTVGVHNYSWRKFPFIWNEVPFHVAYESDMPYIEKILRTVTQDVLGPEAIEQIKELKELAEQSPIDEFNIKEYPYVSFRTSNNTWVEVIVTYLVHPKRASATRSEIIKRVVPELLKKPDNVMFPKSNAR